MFRVECWNVNFDFCMEDDEGIELGGRDKLGDWCNRL